ncbi:hypothetical protein OEA41_010286 [Lepraria neglecta]|uniref:F-box domain-containing protein n=1 Tax=Lepraria neglecta TaxID=209136 RepID=A0AAD9YX05_9LECA|nr:hypothetical protein OEA41_010286 [Lepraria neglecta]
MANHYEADPMLIPELTDSILAHVQAIPPPCPQSRIVPMDGLAPSLPQLPRELIAAIMRHLSPFSDAPKECSFLVSPSYWLQTLLECSLIPWLWDLDTEAILRKEQSKSKGQEWNWELLIRRMAQNDIYESKKVTWAMENVPLGLRNRKRIWGLIQDIFVEEVSARDLEAGP